MFHIKPSDKAVITGIERGLGRFLFNHLSSFISIVGTSRNPQCTPYYLDFKKPQTIEGIVKTICEKENPNILIQNVGKGFLGEFSDFSLSQLQENFLVNSLSPLLLLKYFLKYCASIRNIIFISSKAVSDFYPYLGAYSAAKKFTEKILEEYLFLHNLPISIIRPGPLKPSDELSPMKMEEGEENKNVNKSELNLKWESPLLVVDKIKLILNSTNPEFIYET
jgi:short-subunit dehydrogenase